MPTELAPVVLAHTIGRSLAPAPPRRHTRHCHRRSPAMRRSLLATWDGTGNESKLCAGVCVRERPTTSDKETERQQIRDKQIAPNTFGKASPRASVLPTAGIGATIRWTSVPRSTSTSHHHSISPQELKVPVGPNQLVLKGGLGGKQVHCRASTRAGEIRMMLVAKRIKPVRTGQRFSTTTDLGRGAIADHVRSVKAAAGARTDNAREASRRV